MATFDIGREISEILEKEQKRIEKVAESAIEQAAKEAVAGLKQSSPKRTGRYSRGWTVDQEKSSIGSVKHIVHNKEYRLTHLLNNGHVVANQFGIYSKRVAGDHHIDQAAQKATNKLVKEITSRIK